MFSLGLNAWLLGMDAWGFKWVNVLIHGLASLAVFWCTFLILRLVEHRGVLSVLGERCFWLAFVAAALWALHPLQGTAVFYIIQRMTSLAALFSWLAVGFYLLARLQQLAGKSGVVPLLFGVLPCFALAVLSKENALLLPYQLLVIELCFGRWAGTHPGSQRLLKLFFIALVLIPTVLGVGYLLWRPEIVLGGYAIRDFTLDERLLTQSRMLWHYLAWFALPDPATLGLYHDDIPLSKSLFNPLSTLLAIFGLAGLTILAVRCWENRPFVSFAILWFFTGHALESTIFALEMVFEHRNYVPIYGFCLLLSVFLLNVQDQPRFRARLFLCGALLLLLGTISGFRAAQYGHPLIWALKEAVNHPESGRAQYSVAKRLIWMARSGEKQWTEIQPEAEFFLLEASRLLPDDPAPILDRMILTGRTGQAVPETLKAALGPRLDSIAAARFAANQFSGLIDDWQQGKLSLTAAELLQWLTRLETNSKTGSLQLATLAIAKGRVFLSTGQLPAAKMQAARAVALMPKDVATYLFQGEIALRASDPGLYAASLLQAKALDTQGIWVKPIAEMEAWADEFTKIPDAAVVHESSKKP